MLLWRARTRRASSKGIIAGIQAEGSETAGRPGGLRGYFAAELPQAQADSE